MSTTVLPPGPYPLKSGYATRRVIGGALMMLVGLAMVIGGGWWQGGEARALLRENAVWEHGIETPASVEGTKKANHFIFNDYDLKVEYADAAGGYHHHKLEFVSVFSSIDDGVRPFVRYLPDHPDRYVLSWAHSIKGGRWTATLLFMGIFVGFGGILAFGGWTLFQQIGHAKRALAGHAVEATCTGVKTVLIKGKDKGGRTYSYQGVDPSGVAFDGKVVFNLDKGRPLWTDKTESKLVVLCGSGKKERVALRHDFYPLNLSEGQLHDFRAHLERRQRGLG